MPLSFDITSPVSNQQVGSTVGVVGTYTGDAGNPFQVRCSMNGSAQNSTQNVQPNLQNGTWQCTFTNMPVGTYDISADVAGTVGSNPAVNVQVVGGQPIEVVKPKKAEPPRSSAATADPDGPKTHRIHVHGTTAPGYGLADGYVVCCYLLAAGTQVSSGGRLTTFHRTAAGHAWRYELIVPAWAWTDAAVLLVELWKVGGEKAESLPAGTVSYPIQTKE